LQQKSSGDIILIPRRLPDKLPWWRFSLREFLLAVTAAAALIALAVKSFPSGPSSFVRQYDALQDFKQLCKEEGAKLKIAGGGSSSSMGPGTSTRSWHWYFRETSLPLRQLVSAYQARVERTLAAHGCRIDGRGGTGGGFSYSYRSGSRKGDIVVEFVNLPDGRFQMFVFCVEFTRR
jgi:hypothetical protein